MKYLPLILFFLSFSVAWSQNITGMLTDASNNIPVDGGFVTRLTFPQKTYIISTYTEESGEFSIHRATNDSVFLSINTVGYKDTLILIPPSYQENISLGTIPLELNREITLDEFVVTANPYNLHKGVDRIIMSMTYQNELSKNNTIWGMLRYAPMLKVDDIQGISMPGKQNLELYINGRKSTMSGAEMQNYLKSLPAESISNIELITNPGGTFNVAAQTGIVNVNLKRNENEGLKGFASAQMWQTHYNKQIGSLNLNYVKGKFDLKTTLSARNVGDWNETESEIYFPKTGLINLRNSTSSNRRQPYQGNIDIAFRPDKKQTLGIITDFSIWKGKPEFTSVSRYAKKNQPQRSRFHPVKQCVFRYPYKPDGSEPELYGRF